MVVKTTKNVALAAAHSIEPDRWWDSFGALLDRIAPRFSRYEPLRHAGALMVGLLSGLDRKNCWSIAEQRGDANPHGLQHLLSRARWDTEAVGGDLRRYVKEAFGDPEAIIAVDETGDLKKGTATVGVQRQYTGTAGRIENAQVAVYLTYIGVRGHALIDRALYLPKSWTDDPGRCAAAGVPEGTGFATKPALAQRMLFAALDDGMPAKWVTGDEVYGNNTDLRTALEDRQVGFVMAVSCDHRIPSPSGPVRVDSVARGMPAASWQVRSAGVGTKGPRLYSWALLDVSDQRPGCRSMLLRRNDATGELAYYRCYSPVPVPLAELIWVAGRRWKIEESFQAAKGQAGLDQHQVRTWTSWHRWTILVMLAMAFLAVTTAAERDRAPAPVGLIPLTLNEFRRLFDALAVGVLTDREQILKWSIWRRKHQSTARLHHYRRRSQAQNLDLRL